MSGDSLNVQQAVTAVMGDVLAIGKNQRVSEGPARFNFRGVDDVVQAVGPALRAHGVVFAPVRVVSVEHERYSTKSGTSMDGVTIVVEYEFTGPAGDKLPVAAAGQSADAGDKAVSKAMSVAYRTALLEGLCIPTGEPDPDSTTHERGTGEAPFDTAPFEAKIDRATTPAELRGVGAELNQIRMPQEAHQILLGRYQAREQELAGMVPA